MHKFISKAFSFIFDFIIIIAFFIVAIIGYNHSNPLLIWIIGFIAIILSTGIISLLININANIQLLVNNIINNDNVINTESIETNKMINETTIKIENILKNINSNINIEDIKMNIFKDKNKINEAYNILIKYGKIEMNEYLNTILYKGNKIDKSI